MPVWGWDASDFDWPRGPMDLAAAAKDGIQLFTHKATEGANVKHVRYAEALGRARAAGIELLGAYHVVRSVDVAAQVRYFLGYLDTATPWWHTHRGFFLQVDLEKWPYDQVSAATGKAFVAALRAATSKTVVLYASRGQYGDSLDGIDVPLWNAAYGTNPVGPHRDLYPGDGSSRWAPYSGRSPMLLQFGSRATIGTQPTCDINAFRGTYDQLKAIIEGDDMALRDEIVGNTSTPGMGDRNAAVLLSDIWNVIMRGKSSGGGLWSDSPFAQLLGRPAAALTDDQVERIAAAVVGHADNPLGDADKPAIVAAVKQALREGLA